MIGLIRIKYTGWHPRLMKRELNAIKKRVWENVGIFWHKEMRPKHFTRAGAKEYRYTARSGERDRPARSAFFGSYTGRKLRQFGHTLPLVYSGLSRERSRVRNVRATSKGVRVIINAPALNLRPKGGKVFMRDEMTRVSRREHAQMERLFGRLLERLIKIHPGSESKKLA